MSNKIQNENKYLALGLSANAMSVAKNTQFFIRDSWQKTHLKKINSSKPDYDNNKNNDNVAKKGRYQESKESYLLERMHSLSSQEPLPSASMNMIFKHENNILLKQYENEKDIAQEDAGNLFLSRCVKASAILNARDLKSASSKVEIELPDVFNGVKSTLIKSAQGWFLVFDGNADKSTIDYFSSQLKERFLQESLGSIDIKYEVS